MEMNWSRWFRCESSFGLLLVPKQPGIYALAEEILQPAGPYSRRMLAVFDVEEAEDLARALSRLFAAGSPWRQKLTEERCYLRYAVAPEAEVRRGAATALKNWLTSQRDTATQLFEPASAAAADPEAATEAERAVDRVAKGPEYAKVFPAGF
jgi:acyl-CoA reductase-like NAD-dependent aldehyde dehydrogenase